MKEASAFEIFSLTSDWISKLGFRPFEIEKILVKAKVNAKLVNLQLYANLLFNQVAGQISAST